MVVFDTIPMMKYRPLEKLFNKLNSEYCKYIKVDNPDSSTSEVLLISRNASECVSLISNGQNEILISYMGDAESMRETVTDLRLPNSWPTNLGEQVLYLFKGDLRRTKDENPTLQRSVPIGFEDQLMIGLKKLAHVYSGGSIDQEFYENRL